jgi:hypothetical protein
MELASKSPHTTTWRDRCEGRWTARAKGDCELMMIEIWLSLSLRVCVYMGGG